MLRHLILLAILVSLLPAGAAVVQAAPLAQTGADWPQLQYDGQRSGASPQQVRGPYRFYWRWNAGSFAARTQPVVAGGRLFIGDLQGQIHALDADADQAGGAPLILWSRDLGSPIRTSAAVAGDTLIVATHDGLVRGLRTSDGGDRWIFRMGLAITAAPLVAGDTVYVASTSGVLAALAVADGALRWNFRADGPIVSPPALASDGKRIFFVADDMRAYALHTANGIEIWRTPLQGQSTIDRWPVVIGDTVIFRTMPLRHFRDLLFRGDAVLDQAGELRADPAADWQAIRPLITQHLATHPDQQTFFALNTADGKSRGTPPLLYTGGNQDTPAPPTVYDGDAFMFARTRRGIQNDSPIAVHIATKYDADMIRLDPQNFTAETILASNEFSYQWRATSDEGAELSLAGDLLLINSWERLGAIDLASGANVGIAQVSHNYPGCGSQCQSNNALMPFFPAPQEPQSPANGEGNARVPAIVAAGRIFWRVGDGGLAAIGPEAGAAAAVNPGSRSAERVSLGPAASTRAVSAALPAARTTADLATYISAAPAGPVAEPPADLVQLLEQEVRRIVATQGHMKPLFIQRGWATTFSWPTETEKPDEGQASISHNSSLVSGNAYWYDPGEMIYTLSSVYPYISSELQAELKQYLRREIERYDPLASLPFGGLPWLREGVDRTAYSIPFRDELNTYPPPAPPVQTIYALWAYGEYVGEWEYVESRWERIDALWKSYRTQLNSYARISGAVGYYRIATRLGKNAAAGDALERGTAALNTGLNFAAFRNRAAELLPDMSLNTPAAIGARGQVFFGLTPEIGRYLREQLRPQVDAELGKLTGNRGAILWYATHASAMSIEPFTEQSFHGPDLAWSLFLAHAYGQGADRNSLRRWLDRPFALGDLYYLQKIVATIQAPGAAVAAPKLADPRIERIGLDGVVLRWNSDLPASGWVEYGTTAAYGGRSAVWTAPVTEHRITVSGLRPDQTYHLRVCSTNAGGTVCSADLTARTGQGYSFFLPKIGL
ncbi:MAG: PQQ-binding-like beta-propeller repeat protein [Oscillochloris sp.]|nr:PQQ-binding-like beta-propeller repeat protein [Oscillochloris sp.]